MGQGNYHDTDALAFEAGAEVGERHDPLYVGKRKRTSKGLEIVFDPDQHREYVTGFHKRKQERRKMAQKQKAEKDRKQRLEDKAERRAKLREELDLERYDTPPESETEEQQDVGKGVKVYNSGNALTTVTVAPLILDSDEEQEAPNDGDVDSDSEDFLNASTRDAEARKQTTGRKHVAKARKTGQKPGPKPAKKRKKRAKVDKGIRH